MIRFRSYKTLQEEHIQVRFENYEQTYLGRMKPGDTPEKIRRRLEEQPPRFSSCHSLSVSDVLVSTARVRLHPIMLRKKDLW